MRFRSIALASVALACTHFAATLAAAQAPDASAPELQKVREALDKYQDVVAAVHDGYFSTLGCIEYPKPGAPGHVPYRAGGMGVHFFHVALLGKLDPLKPPVLVYQPVNGKLRLVAAEYFVPLTPDVKERPQLFGHPFDGPMEGHHPLMPVELKHYDLHVWLWKKNPAGIFSPTNPDVKCPNSAYTFKETAPALVAH
jgi:hypothetical protein